MVFKSFRAGIILRVIGISLASFITIYFVFTDQKYLSGGIFFAFVCFLISNLIYYVENTNRKLKRFLESVRFSDFTSGYTSDNKLGHSFRELNKSFNQVLDAFREARAEKEEHLLYLNTVVQHVAVGLISFDLNGNVEIYNNAARKMLQVVQLRNIKVLEKRHPALFKILQELPPGGKTLLKENNETQLTIHAIEIKLRGKTFKLVSLQNIQVELEQKEIEAWQNLTKVLRHEIMNSMTPIASLTETLNEILNEDLVYEENGSCSIASDPVEDLKEGLLTIKNRSKGLIRFVDDYRNYTNIPIPKFTMVPLKLLFSNVNMLMKPNFQRANIDFMCDISPQNIEIIADEELIEMVLINLVKNAHEAVGSVENGRIRLRGYLDEFQRTIIEVEDNGPGIIPDALDRIFIPFFTTKKGGSGIGLSLSRQIIQMHNGNISAISIPHHKTVFTIKFN